MKGKWVGPFFGGLVAIAASFAALWAVGSLLSRVGLPLPACLRDAVPYLLSVAAGIAVLMIFCAVMRGRIHPEKERPKGRLRFSPTVFFALFLFLSAAGIIASLVSGHPDGNGAYGSMSDTEFTVAAVIGTVVYPLAEEALFRRGYLGALASASAPAGANAAAVLIQGALFASVHPASGRLFAFAAGTALGLAALEGWRDGGVRYPLVCAAAHGAYNLSQYVSLALWRGGIATAQDVAACITGVSAVALGLVLAVRAGRSKSGGVSDRK